MALVVYDASVILRDAIDIRAEPRAIFRFFEDIEFHYRQWHPDHVLFRWISRPGLEEGAVFYFEEYIAGKLLRKRVVFTRVIPGRHLEFAPTFWLMRLFLPRIVFRVEDAGDLSRVVAEVHLRLGPLAQWAHRKEIEAVRAHMRVEGINMKRIVEGQDPPPGDGTRRAMARR